VRRVHPVVALQCAERPVAPRCLARVVRLQAPVPPVASTSSQLSFLASRVHRPDQTSREKSAARHVSSAGRDVFLSGRPETGGDAAQLGRVQGALVHKVGIAMQVPFYKFKVNFLRTMESISRLQL
jgi:hypothetical protein